MKAKIFVCSNSAIDYINHSENIKSIPTIIKFSADEEYNDFIDISQAQFYNRLKITKEKHVTVDYQKYNVINEYLMEALNDGYTEFLFLIPSKSFSNLAIPLSIIKNENTNLAITLYETNTISYPLAYMALEADRLLNEENENMDFTLEKLDLIKRNHHIFFFNPSADETKKNFQNKYKSGTAYSLENGIITKLEKNSSATSFDEIIKLMKEETADCDVVLFICYNDKTSKYVSIFGEYIQEYIKENKKVKLSPLAPGVGVLVGYDVIRIGYIIK